MSDETFQSSGVTINAEAVTIAGDVVGRDKHEGVPGEKVPPPFQLPPDLPTFAGRDREMATLDDWLPPGKGTTIALVGLKGMAGVGKSVLAIHVAHHWRDRFTDGVVWVDLRRGNTESGLRHIAASFGYRQTVSRASSIAELAAQVRSILRDKCALIVLDNAENLPAADFDYLLPGVTRCAIIVTSRRAFPALERHGRVMRVDTLDELEALELLAGVLGQDDTELPARKRLCARLGFLPLALDIAAQRMKSKRWAAAEMLTRLDHEAHRLAELELPMAESPEDSVTLAFALSYRALPPQEARVFRALGVFIGGFTPASVAGVLALPDVHTGERTLDNLTAISLVRPSAHSGRYDLHPLLADYSRSLAATAAELSALRCAHAAFCLVYARQFKQDFDALESELPNLLGAMDWADEERRSGSDELRETTARMVMQFVSAIASPGVLHTRGHWNESMRWGKKAADAALQVNDGPSAAVFIHNVGIQAQLQGDLAGARRLYDQSLAINRELGDKQGIAQTLHQLGRLAQDTGDLAEARHLYDQSLGIAHELGDRQGIAQTLHQLGWLTQDTGDLAEARRLYDEAGRTFQELGAKQEQATVLHQLGRLAQDTGDLAEARRLYDQSLALKRDLGDKQGIAQTLHQLGWLTQATGDLAEAHRLYDQSLAIERELGDKQGIAQTLHQLATLAQDTGDQAEAHRLYDQSLGIERELGDKQGIASSLHQLGRLAEEEGNLAEAAQLFEESLKLLTELGSPDAQVARRSWERVRRRTDNG